MKRVRPPSDLNLKGNLLGNNIKDDMDRKELDSITEISRIDAINFYHVDKTKIDLEQINNDAESLRKSKNKSKNKRKSNSRSKSKKKSRKMTFQMDLLKKKKAIIRKYRGKRNSRQQIDSATYNIDNFSPSDFYENSVNPHRHAKHTSVAISPDQALIGDKPAPGLINLQSYDIAPQTTLPSSNFMLANKKSKMKSIIPKAHSTLDHNQGKESYDASKLNEIQKLEANLAQKLCVTSYSTNMLGGRMQSPFRQTGASIIHPRTHSADRLGKATHHNQEVTS